MQKLNTELSLMTSWSGQQSTGISDEFGESLPMEKLQTGHTHTQRLAEMVTIS